MQEWMVNARSVCMCAHVYVCMNKREKERGRRQRGRKREKERGRRQRERKQEGEDKGREREGEERGGEREKAEREGERGKKRGRMVSTVPYLKHNIDL